MSDDYLSPGANFDRVEELLQGWLKERRALVANYTLLASGLHTRTARETLRNKQAILCELLVDYVSAGHFEIFIKLVEEAESFADGSHVLAARLMPAITDTTERILAYEEKYTGKGQVYPPESGDLSVLGETLETRLMLEDQLISELHDKHRRPVVAPVKAI